MPEEDIVQKYRERLARELGAEDKVKAFDEEKLTTDDYEKFKETFMPAHLTLYEKAGKFVSKFLNFTYKDGEKEDLKEALEITHMNITPGGVVGLAYLLPILLFVFGVVFSILISIKDQTQLFNSFFLMFFLILSFLLYFLLQKMPFLLANRWRLKASNQMINCIFYIVTYMRHTANLENAVAFASEHLTAPLSLDMKKVMWDVETNRFESVKESLDHYLETWRKWNLEFVEAFHLVEASLFEPTEVRRMSLIEKSLNLMLSETYEKMLHYTHNLKSPITMLHMLGIILPILGLVILPMVTSFMTAGSSDAPGTPPGRLALYIAAIYNVFLPLVVYIFGKVILSSRPTGYGDVDITEAFPDFKKLKYFIIRIFDKEIKIRPILIAGIFIMVMLSIGVYPLIARFMQPDDLLLAEKPFFESLKFLGYKISQETDSMIGPYGIGAALLSVLIPMGIGVGIGIYYKIKASNVIKIRNDVKELEKEFASGLFQLGNRIGDGIPTEIAFEKVADVLQSTNCGEFFRITANNIRNSGMSIERALFNKKNGAIKSFPSNTIISAMKVLIESAKKGPQIASRTLLTVAEYIKEIHRVNERLNDLMADIVSSMKQQISFMAPVIAGIVVGIASMIVTIMGVLQTSLKVSPGGEGGGAADVGGAAGMINMFGDGVATFYIQIIIGLYVVQIVYILTVLVNSIENGDDKLSEQYLLGKNMIKSTMIYSMLSLAVIFAFNFLAAKILDIAL
jgi:hypothetical protein